MAFVAAHNALPTSLNDKPHTILENHMFAIPEQFSNATRANFESQFAIFSTLASKAFEGVEKLVDLNVNAVKATLEESSVAARQLLSAKDPQEFFSLSAAQAQPAAEKAMSYTRQLASIAAGTQAEFNKAAETQIAETNRKVIALVEEVTRNAPAGTENMVNAFKTSIGNAQAGYEQFAKTTKQAAETFENNVSAAVGQFTQAAQAAQPAAKAAGKK